jgi:hypothetical protein
MKISAQDNSSSPLQFLLVYAMSTTPYHNAGRAPIVAQREVVANVAHGQPSQYNHTTSFQGQPANKENLIQVSTYEHQSGGGNDWIEAKPQTQPRRYRDGFWAILFYVHVAIVIASTVKFAPVMLQALAADYVGGANRYLKIARLLQDDEDEVDIDTDSLILVLAFAGLAGLIISTISLTFMMNCAQQLIKTALFFNIFVTGAMLLLALLAGVLELAIMALIGLIISSYYTYVVWNRIPFAASNLITAVSAVRANIGLAFFAYTNLIVSFLWSILWSAAFVSTFFAVGGCDAEGNCENEINGFAVFLFLVSYYWTAQVLKNVVHVTVAGTVGTWWFVPNEANGCCSQGVRNSYWRSITSSFGSICFGSLLVAIIQAVKEIVHSMREGNGSMLACLLDCILGCIEGLVEYFNQWAFVYVGIYGYSFLEAGSSVMTLFKSRGWTAIIADVLVDTALFMVSVGVGILTGLVGLAAGSILQLDVSYLPAAFG